MKTIYKVSSFLLTTGILVGSFVGFWFGPWSPNLDHRARTLIVEDHLEEGVALFQWTLAEARSYLLGHIPQRPFRRRAIRVTELAP